MVLTNTNLASISSTPYIPWVLF